MEMEHKDNDVLLLSNPDCTLEDLSKDWNYFYDTIMNDKDIMYLSDYEMKASMGREYIELSNMYPDWGQMLHSHGNMLTHNELAYIFRNGMLLWYIKYFTKPIINILQINN